MRICLGRKLQCDYCHMELTRNGDKVTKIKGRYKETERSFKKVNE